MRAGVLIAIKDLKLRLRDKSAYIWGIVAPLALGVVFSGIFGAVDDQGFSVEYAVLDLDGGPIAEAFIGALEGAEDAGFSFHEVDSLEQAKEEVEVGSDAFAGDDEAQAHSAFVLPEGLSESVEAGEGGQLTVIGGRGAQFSSQIAYSFAEAFASEIQAVEVSVRTVLESDPSLLGGMMPPGTEAPPGAEAAPPGSEAMPPGTVGDPGAAVAQLGAEAAQTANPVSIEDIGATTKQLDGNTYMVAGMAIFFLFFTVQFGVSGLLEERRIGTMQRLLAAPIRRPSIILGKAITSFVLGVLSLAILAIVTTLALGAEWGDPLGVGVLIVAAVFAAMGILAIVASVAKTQEQASNFQAIIAMVLGLLGGTFFPLSQIGGFIEKLSLATPHAWFLRGLGDLAGGELSAIWPAVGALVAFGLITGSASWFFLMKAVDR